ncbi:MAG: hypothetical protein GC154_12545 [bacterium]|nr:hypothetical protein [bacterium]
MNESEIQKNGQRHMAAAVDVRQLVLHCARLESELGAQRGRLEEQERRLIQMDEDRHRLDSLAELGRAELERLRGETLSRIRAAAMFTGESERHGAIKAALKDEQLSLEEIRRFHRLATAEFNALYPTRPASRAAGDGETLEPRRDWSAFCMKPGAAMGERA